MGKRTMWNLGLRIGIDNWIEEVITIRKSYYEGKFIVGKGQMFELGMLEIITPKMHLKKGNSIDA